MIGDNPYPGNVTILSFGGGVDSSAILELQLRGIHDFGIDCVIFADTGAESQGTYDNIAAYKKRCAVSGIDFHTVAREGETITEWVLRLGIVPLMPGGSHICSKKFKSDVIQKFVKSNYPIANITYLIGIEHNETNRVTRFKQPKGDQAQYRYPLIELNMTRADCLQMLKQHGQNVQKSSCFFCPFMKDHEIHAAYQDADNWNIIKKIEETFSQTSEIKHRAWIEAGKPLKSNGKCNTGHWRHNSWEKGARLFATTHKGKRMSVNEWEEVFGMR